MGQMGQTLLRIVDHSRKPQQRLLVVRIELQNGLKFAAGLGRLPGTHGLVTLLQECCDLLVSGKQAGLLRHQQFIHLLAVWRSGNTILRQTSFITRYTMTFYLNFPNYTLNGSR